MHKVHANVRIHSHSSSTKYVLITRQNFCVTIQMILFWFPKKRRKKKQIKNFESSLQMQSNRETCFKKISKLRNVYLIKKPRPMQLNNRKLSEETDVIACGRARAREPSLLENRQSNLTLQVFHTF